MPVHIALTDIFLFESLISHYWILLSFTFSPPSTSTQVIIDTELVLMYVNTLKPWFQKLHAAFSPETLIKLFPSIVVTLSLVWQHSGYCIVLTSLLLILRVFDKLGSMGQIGSKMVSVCVPLGIHLEPINK